MLHKNLVDAPHGRSSPLKYVNHPTQSYYRPGELHHVSVEGDKIAHADAAQQNFAAAQPQHEHHSKAQHGFQGRPQHAHQSDQLQTARNVFLVGFFESLDLRLFLHVGANHARAGEVLLGPRGNIGKHRLDALKALVDLSTEILHHDAHHGQGQKSIECEPRADGEHEDQRPRSKHDSIGRIHDGGAEQHSDSIQVIGGSRHDVASAGALVVGITESFQMSKQIIAQIELNVAGDADYNPAGEELKDALNTSHRNQQRGIEEQLPLGHPQVQIVDCSFNDLRKENPNAVG